ncbi:hypothetical protein XENORESO_022063 [Xenotaenia resolanae]|uniref:Uncharacterized protein n=1 Tax=Xenotaenia resolanae TaxID=208358 RepID=A0ABV0VL32_9TELE
MCTPSPTQAARLSQVVFSKKALLHIYRHVIENCRHTHTRTVRPLQKRAHSQIMLQSLPMLLPLTHPHMVSHPHTLRKALSGEQSLEEAQHPCPLNPCTFKEMILTQRLLAISAGICCKIQWGETYLS